MSNNRIDTKEAGKALVGALASNTVLKELDLSNNCIWDNSDGPGFAKELAVGLSENGALETLNISNNDIFRSTQSDEAPSAAAKALAHALGRNRSITDLNIASNWIKTQHIKIIAPAISINRTLTSLNLSSNRLGTEGVKYVTEVVKENVSVRRFDLHHFDLWFDCCCLCIFSYYNIITRSRGRGCM